MKTIFTLILTLFVLTSCQKESSDLSLKLEQGKEYKQLTSAKMSIIQDINGQKVDIKMTVGGSMTFFVKDVVENAYNMDTKFNTLSMSMQMPQGLMEFSSEKDDVNDIFSTVLRAMKDKSFGLTMTTTGKVTEVKDVDILWDAALNSFEQLSPMQKDQIRAQVLKAYGAEALKGNIEMVTAIYPNTLVSKGDKWTINTKLESGMSGNMTTDYEFIESTAEYVLIKGKSTIETADKDAYVETNGMLMRYDLTGSMDSEIKVDKTTGWIIEAKMNQKIEGDTYIKETPQLPNGMKIPMTMVNDMVITNK